MRAPGAPRDANQTLVEREKDYRPTKGNDRRDRPKGVAPANNKGRTFDRKSGTGRAINEVKRGGQGKANWGGDLDVAATEGLKEEKPAAGEDEKEEEVKEGEEKAPAAEGEGEKKEGAEGEKKEPVAPAVEELSLDEYLEKLKKKAPKVEALKPRTVTSDDFAGLTPLKRGVEEEPKKAAPAAAAEKKDKKKTEKKDDDEFVSNNKLAAELLKFQSHRDSFRGERRGGDRRERRDDRGDRGDRGDRPHRENRDNRGPRGPRAAQGAPAADASPAATQANIISKENFPALGHGASPADQAVAGKA